MSSTNILKLGEKIVEELLLDNGVDTLSKWMAHYIAELIEKAKHCEGREKEKYEKECFETILKLWEEIYKVPNVIPPLSRFKNIYDLCEEMMSKDKYRYFPEKHQEDTNEYLILAKVVDSLSKKIVQNAFYLAYQNAKEDEKEWLEFDMLDDVKQLQRIEILFEDGLKSNELNIHEKEKQELIDAYNSLMDVIEILKND